MFVDGEFKEIVPVKKRKIKLKGLMFFIPIFVIMLVFTVSYSFFFYNKEGNSHTLIAGNIYLNTTDNGNVSLTGLYPMSDTDGIKNGIKYRFDVSGYNLSNKTIYYGIYINKGDEITDKTRLRDGDVKLYLTKTINDVTSVVMGPYNVEEFNRNILYNDTFAGNISKENEVNVEYELTMWISDRVLISDSITNLDGRSIYTSEEFKNSYASVKVEVYGDFVEKSSE